MMFLLGMQAMFWHDPPTYFRSITATRWPCPAQVQAAIVPPVPPPRLGSHPGVENKNESVVRNITTARALPTVDVFGDHGRRAIKMAMATSTTPNPAENCRTLRKWYIHPINGLCATSGWIPFASYPVNFIN